MPDAKIFVDKMYDCGCYIKTVATEGGQESAISYCPKHKAAPAMYEALKQAKLWFETHDNSSTGLFAHQVICEALRQADGKEIKHA